MLLRIIVLFCWCTVIAQNNVIHYSTSNGLPHDITYGLFQDSKGYIWIGTDNGLVKYDGNEFKLFTIKQGLRSNYVIDIDETQDQKIVVGTWGGGIHFIQNDSVLQVAEAINHFSKISKINTSNNSIIASSGKNDFYFLHKEKENYIEEEWNFKIHKNLQLFKLKNKLKDNAFKVVSPVKVNNKLLYVGGNNFGLEKMKGIITLNFNEHIYKEEFSFMNNIEVNDIIYENGNYIAISNNEEITFNNEQILKNTPIKFKSTSKHRLKRFVHTKKYNVYIFEDEFHISDKIILYDNATKKEINFSSENKITSLVSDVIKDRDENIWISLNGQGVYFIPNTFEYYNKTYFQGMPVHDILELNEEIYFLSLTSIHALRGNEYDTYPTKYFLEGFNTTISNKDTVTITTSTITKTTHKNSKINNKNKSLNFLKSLYKKRIQKLEITVAYWLDNLVISFKNNTKPPITINFSKETQIKDIQLINNELWIATNLGFYIYDTINFKEKRQVTLVQGLSNTNIKSFVAYESKVYITTIDGLNILDLGNNTMKVYTKNDGLPINNLNDVFIDHHDIIWVSHQKGYSIFKNGHFYNFTKENGSDFSYVNKIIEDKNNYIWLIGSYGAKKINNTFPFDATTKPTMQIEANNAQYKANIIDFSGDELLLQYKIDDNDWVSTKDRTYDFSNYKFGKHSVQFKVRRPSSDWNYSKAYNFINKAPWYKTWWGLLLISILILGLLIYRILRVQKKNKLLHRAITNQKRLEKELSEVRQNVASDFHDELGNKLAGITIVSELMLKDELIKQSNSFEMLQQIQKDAKSLYFGIRDFVWSIDSKSDYLEELIVYLSDFGEELFQNSQITFKVQKKINNEIKKLPTYWSRQLLLLFKEAMTNTLKHSKATEVTLFFTLEKDNLIIQLIDNGIGFTTNSLKRTNGLNNMQKRVKKINGRFDMITNSGTKIIFSGNINTKIV